MLLLLQTLVLSLHHNTLATNSKAVCEQSNVVDKSVVRKANTSKWCSTNILVQVKWTLY